MAYSAPLDPAAPGRWTVEQYLRLVDEGVLDPDDRLELLEGVVVAMAPQNVAHAAGVFRLEHALHRAVGDRALVRVQLPLRAGEHSLPEPDTAVVGGALADYDRVHPTSALLVVEVADSSLKQDRLTKRAIYAAAGIPEYWIVNLPDDCVEVRREPEPSTRRYASTIVARRGETVELIALPGVRVSIDDLLPEPEPR